MFEAQLSYVTQLLSYFSEKACDLQYKTTAIRESKHAVQSGEDS